MSMTRYFAWEYRGLMDVGAGCISQIGVRFQELGARRIGIITDKWLVNAGVVDMVKDILEFQGAPVVAGVYDKIEMDAQASIVNDCKRWCGENWVEGLLALGGGSVLDTAKAVKAMIGFGVQDINEIMRGTVGLHAGLIVQPLTFPHIAIPTTAGTGAESSPIAEIFFESAGMKGNLSHPHLPAQNVFLDPTVTYSLPPHLTAEAGCDALAHCMDGFFAANSNSFSDALALQAIRLIRKYLPTAVEQGQNVEARTQLLIASNMAMQAFVSAGGSGPIHTCSRAISARLNIPHGLADGVLISTVMKAADYHYAPRIVDFAAAFGTKLDGLPPQEYVEATVASLEEFKKQVNIPARFPQTLSDEDKNALLAQVFGDILGFRFLPGRMDQILELSFSH